MRGALWFVLRSLADETRYLGSGMDGEPGRYEVNSGENRFFFSGVEIEKLGEATSIKVRL